MSTFHGKINEIPEISVDRFDGENMNSDVFFLSHCHTDHMRGLNSQYFQELLLTNNKFLYLSSISAIILRKQFPKIANRVIELPLEQASSVTLKNNVSMSVTCIPAGHCPGSVMFLFESEKVSILYTGDYRIHPSDIRKFKCFYDSFGNVKEIHKIYLDTTFFMESYSSLPRRDHSLSELCKIIRSWISQSPDNCIKLDAPAKYGYEYVLKEIFNTLKMPVHIDEDKYNFYSLIPELDECVTKNENETQIHHCRFSQFQICPSWTSKNIRIIKLSAFRWQNDDFKRGITETDQAGTFYVCYSTHASYQEGLALLDFLKPKDIHICVERPNNPEEDLHIRKLVEKEIKKFNQQNEATEAPKLFDVNKSSDVTDLGRSASTKIFKRDNILDSPPRNQSN